MKRRLSRSAYESTASRLLRGTTKAFAALDSFDRLFKRAAEELERHKQSPSRQAGALLCSRIADDLRAFRILVRKGYFAQAMTIGASALEAIWTLAYVAESDALATEWFAHKDLHKSLWRVAALRAAANPKMKPLLNLIYEVFSAAKHHNPRILQDLVSARSLEGQLLEVDPAFSPRAGYRIGVFASLLLYAALDGLNSLIARESPPLSDEWLDLCTRSITRHTPTVQFAVAEMMRPRKPDTP